MARALAARGHAVTLACGRYQGAVTGLDGPFRRGFRDGVVEGITLREFDIPCANAMPLRARGLAFLRFAARAGRLALGARWDLVIASSTPLTVALPALAARRLRGTPFLFEIRDPWPESPRALGGVPGPVLAGMELLADAACRRAERVIALTEGMAETARARGAQAVTVLPQGADLDLFRPASPRRDGGMLALYAGAHGAANGLDQLLDAAALLRGAGITLLLVGEGARKPALMARAAAEALPVRFRDPMPKPDLARLMAGADVALLCLAPVPQFGAWSAPNKLVEALAAGLPVVANVPGDAARLLAEGCGIATPPGDAAALAAALLALRDPARRAAMGKAARRIAEERFDMRRIAAAFVAQAEEAACAR
jgi:glycosyltransferase involved in cell wall biosynthesis